MKTLRSFLPYVLLLTLLAAAARAEVNRTSGLIAEKTEWENPYYVIDSFVDSGGGYLGICAGAYLATAKYDWGLALVNAATFTGKRDIPGVGPKSMWFRGTGNVKMELTEEGKTILGDLEGQIETRYANGPILLPAEVAGLSQYVPLAFFRTEISKWDPQEGTMINTPAIVASKFGKGRAIAVSPHPESVEGLESLVLKAVSWVAGKDNRAGR